MHHRGSPRLALKPAFVSNIRTGAADKGTFWRRLEQARRGSITTETGLGYLFRERRQLAGGRVESFYQFTLSEQRG